MNKRNEQKNKRKKERTKERKRRNLITFLGFLTLISNFSTSIRYSTLSISPCNEAFQISLLEIFEAIFQFLILMTHFSSYKQDQKSFGDIILKNKLNCLQEEVLKRLDSIRILEVIFDNLLIT